MADLLSQFPSLPPDVQQQILNGPAMTPPRGVAPNFNHPPNSTGVGIAFGVLCAIVAVVCFFFRVYCQTRVEKRWHTEDYFGLLAFISYLGAIISFFVFIYYGGFLVHQWNIRFRTFQKVLENSLAITFSYILLMLFAKVGILLEWDRIFNPASERNGFFWASHTILALNVLLYISILIAEALSCRPARYLWQPWIAGVCFNKRALDLASAYFNLVADVLILLLPQRIIWSLQMSKLKKLKVSLIFSAGIITCLCAVFRIVAIHPLKYAGDGDTNYLTSKVYMLTIAESTFVILVFCMPALPKGFVESAVGRGIILSLHSLASMTRRSNTSGAESSHRRTRTKGFAGIDSTSDLHMHDVENNVWSVSSHPGERQGEPGIVRRIDISTHHEQKSSSV